MSRPMVVAVGPPQAFKIQIAQALEADPEDIHWVPTVTAAEEMLGERNGGRTPGLLILSPEVKDVDALGMAEV
ncbi:MAG: hypothetical protein M3454_03055, partial [Actinomycetota bacterium]|nr:hypothetical protein [Actinomycetota bacterium]